MHRTCTALAIIAFFLCLPFLSKAQTTPEDEYKQRVSVVFSPLNTAIVPNGYLYEYSYPIFPPSKLAGIRLDSNHVSPFDWKLCYAALQAMHIYGTNTLPSLSSAETQIKNYENLPNNQIAFTTLSVKYASLKENALTSNLLVFQNQKLYDVAGRTQSPYQQQEAFVVAPVVSSITGLQTSFVFRNDLLYSNYGLTTTQIQSLQIDADNGQGWQTVVWNTPLQVNYTQEGTKELKYRFTFVGGNVKEGHSYFKVKNPPQEVQRYGTIADFDTTFAGGKMSIIYSKKNTTSPKRLRKPLIVVEGFDQHQIAPAVKKTNYSLETFVNQISILLADPLNPNTTTLNGLIDDIGEYDLVFLDYADGTASIPDVNVPFFQSVLRYVYTNKVNMPNGVREKNVVLGLSMGGLVGRYGLAQLARRTGTDRLVAEDTRLLMTHDSPHRGANIPLGFQALIRQMREVTVFGQNLANNQPINEQTIIQGVRVLDSPAAAQLLLYRPANTREGVIHNTFINGVYQPMVNNVPNQPYQFVATSMGSECGIWNAQGNATFMNGGFWVGPEMSGYIGNWLWLSTEVISLRFEPTVRAIPHGGGTNQLSRLVVKRRFNNWLWLGPLGAILMLVDEIRPVYQETYTAPGGLLFLDGAPGGTILSQDMLNITFGGLGYPSTRTCFVPQASALDYPLNEHNLLYRKYNHSYLGTNPNETGVKKYITQEPNRNASSDNLVVPNLEHAQNPTPRLGLWMFRTMENISTAQQICNRSCPPSGLPELSLNKGLLCVGERISFLNNTGSWTGITVTPSANLGFDNATKQIEALSEGYAWINASIRLGDCDLPLKSIYLWIGKPYSTNAIKPLDFGSFQESARYDGAGNLKICAGGYSFETNFDQLPNGVNAGITAFEWETDCGEILSQEDNLTNDDLSQSGGIVRTLETVDGHIGLKPRTSKVIIKFPPTFSFYTCTFRVRLKNACGVSPWMEYTVSNNIDDCGSNTGGSNPWEIITPIAFENPMGSGRLRIRLMDIPNVDYNNLDPKTSAGFTYQIKLFDNSGNEKLLWTGDTIESDADVTFLQQGLYQAKVVFGNGQAFKTVHLIKE